MEGDESYRRTSFDGSKRLREDNRRLREDNQRLLQAVHQNASSSSAEATGPTLAVYNTANAELERKNEMLSKQAELLMHELDEAHNAVRHRDQCMENYVMQANEYERTVARLMADKQATEEALKQHQAKVLDQKQTIEKLSSEVDEAKSATRILQDRTEAKSSQLKELEEECSSLMKRLESESNRNNDLQTMLEAKSEETNAARLRLEKSEKSLQIAKSESAERLEAIVELKHCLSQAKQGEETAKKEMEKCREELNVALLSYDKVEMVCRTLKDQVEALTQDRLKDAKSIEEMVQAVESLKDQHAAEISKQQEHIDELTVTNANTFSLNERILREKNDLEKQHLRQQRAHKEERCRVKTTVQSLTDRISQSESNLDEQNKENKILNQSQSDMAHKIQSLQEELNAERSTLLQERKRADAIGKELKTFKHDCEVQASKHERQINQLKKDVEISGHQQRCSVTDREAEIVSFQQRLEEEVSKYQQLIQTKNELYQEQEAKLSEERDICHRLLERNREVNESLNVLSEQNMSLGQMMEEQTGKMESLGLAMEEAQGRLIDADADLIRAVKDKEKSIEREKEVRRDLRKVQAELDHVRKFGQDNVCR